MRGFIALLLFISSYMGYAAESPCYFAGNFVKCFPATGVWLDNQRSLRLGDAGTTNYVELKAPAAVTTYSMTYPAAQGAANTRLRNNGSGTLVWSLVALGTDVSGQLPPANGGTGQNSTATFPTSGTVVTEAAAETLTNKTLGSTDTITGAVATSLTSGAATVTLPTTTSTLATLALAEALTNKSLNSATNILTNATSSAFSNGAATISLPSTSGTLATLALAETLTNKTVNGNSNTLTVLAGSQLSGLVPTANGGTAISSSAVFPATGTIVTEAAVEGLTNKTLASSNTLTGAIAVNLTSGAATVTLPTSTSTLATLALVETHTNKTMGPTNTLTGATAASFTNTGTVTLPTATDTLVARATTDTLTNKTISGASNTLTVRAASDITGTLPTGNGGTNKSTWTAGSVPYLSSTTAFNEDNANFFWDGTNHRLGIGTAAPQKMFESASSSPAVQWRLTDTSIAHGMTTPVATTTIAQVGDASSDGGIEMDSYAQSTTQAMILKGDNVTASTTVPVMEFRAGKKSGTTTGNGAASDMLYAFSKNDGTQLVTTTGDGVTNFSAGVKIAGSSTLGTFTRGSKSTTFQSDGSSSVATAAVTVNYYRIDDWVTVFFPALTFSGVVAATGYIGAGGPGNINNQTAIDSFARPATATQESLCIPWTLGTTKQTVVGRMLVNTAGTFTLNRDNAVTSFPNGDNTTATNVSFTNPFSCSYYVGSGS